MKRPHLLLLSLGFFCLLQPLQAQYEGRSFLVDRTLEFNQLFGNDNLGNQTSLFLSPRMDYFITDRWSLGGIVYFNQDFISDLTLVGVLPSSRFFFSRPTTKTQWFAEAAIGPLATIGGGSTRLSGAFFTRLGFAHFLVREAAMEVSLEYNNIFGDGLVNNNTLTLLVQFQGFLYHKGEDDPAFVSPVRKGSWLVGNSTASLGGLQSGDFEFTLALNPDIYYFVAGRWALGGRLPLTFTENTVQVEFFPGFRFYGNRLDSRWQWFLELNGGISHARDLGDAENDVRINGYQLTTLGGFNYFFNSAFALEGRLGYRFINSRIEQSFFDDDFTFEYSNIFLTLGFQVFINRK